MSDATQALSALGEMAARLRAVPEALERAKPELAEAMRVYFTECYARGESPDGERWPLTQDGKVAKLTGTRAVVTVTGNKIMFRLVGYEARHSTGRARGGVQRRMLPSGPVPPELQRRFDAIVETHLKAVLK